MFLAIGSGCSGSVRQGAAMRAVAATVSGARMAGALRAVLPRGTFSGVSGTGTNSGPGASAPIARAVLGNGKDAAAVQAAVERLPVPVPAAATACPLRSQAPYDQCALRHLPGGATLEVIKGYVNPASPHSIRDWTAVLTTAQGEQASVSEWNALSPTAPSPSRPQPPLTTAQLERAVSSGTWTALASELPQAPQPPVPPVAPELTEQQILSLIREQIPARLRVANAEGSAYGYADVTLDDGHGEGLLTVTAQRWNPRDPTFRSLFPGSRELPGGIQVTDDQGSRGGGITEWDAGALDTDGLRVAVSELNASAFGLPATRPAPVLTPAQLTSLAVGILRAQHA